MSDHDRMTPAQQDAESERLRRGRSVHDEPTPVPTEAPAPPAPVTPEQLANRFCGDDSSIKEAVDVVMK